MKKRILSLLLAVVMLIGLLPTVALAAEPETGTETWADKKSVSYINDDDPIHIEKTVTPGTEEGKGTLTLEAYVTNPLVKQTTEVPVDVVLVLDISNSMDDAFTPATYSETYNIQKNGEYYYKTTNGKYARAYYCGGSMLGISCDGGWFTSEHGLGRHGGTKLTPKTSAAASGTQFYVQDTKLDALKEAAIAFINNAATVSNDSRIAIVSFADTASEKKGLTAISSETGKKELIDAVNGLKIDGGTDQRAGLAKAKSILDARETKNPSAVLLFTDGEPTGSSGTDFKDGVAGKAVNTAKSLKDGGTIIFTVAVNDKADPAQNPESSGTSKLNKFLHAVSSNYPDAAARKDNFSSLNLGERKPSSSYYRDAKDQTGLLEIFKSVSEEVSKLRLRMDGETVLSDTLSAYFTFDCDDTDAAKGVKVYTEEVVKNETTLKWNSQSRTELQNAVSFDITNPKKLKVTGFDYGENAVTINTEGIVTKGTKLIVEIPIKADETATLQEGQHYYPTNNTTDSKAGLSNFGYLDDPQEKREEKAELNDSPTLKLEKHTPTTATVTITKTFTGEGFQQTMVPNNFNLTLNKVEGEGENVTKTEQTLTRGEGYTWTATLGAGNYEITESNADVDGWTRTTTGLTFEVTATDITKGNKTVTVVNTYSQERTYTLKYDKNVPNDGPVSYMPNQATYGPTAETSYEFNVATEVPERTGYTFKYWSTGSTTTVAETHYGHGEGLTNKITVSNTDPEYTKTLYAQWQVNLYTVTYKDGVNEAAFPDDEHKDVVYNTPIPGYTDSTPTRDGHSFTGWKWYAADDTDFSDELNPAPTKMPAYNLVAVAQWKAYNDATFDLNSLNITKVLTGDGVEDLNRTERTFYVDVYPSDKDMNYDATKDPVATGTVEWTKNGENKFTFDNTLKLDHADTYYFVLKEQKSGVVGMHYDDGAYGRGYFLTIVVTANDAKTGYEATGTLTCAGKKADTITNEYAKPTKETLTTSHIYGLKHASVGGKDLYDWLDEAAQNKQSVLMFPDEDTNKLTVDKSIDKIALAYRVTVKGDTDAVATVKDDSAIYVPIARRADQAYDVAVNEDDSITVTFHKWNMVYLYFIKIVERENGEFPASVVNTALVNGEEINSDPTYINDKTPGGFDFSDIILKDLYVTGDQNFPSSLTFQAKLKLKYFTNVDMSSALSLTADNPTVKDENDTVSEAFPAGWEETLYATFTPDDVKFDAHNTTSFTAQDGSHLFLNFPAEGLYLFSLEEIDDKEDGVKYDSNVYGILVWVGEDRSGKLTVDYVTYGDWKGEDTIGNNVLYDGPINGLTGEKITFYNEVDTGDIPYYPIIPILPTVKDEGKLNKTDHFAYIIGYPDGTVHPNGEITRAEVATIFFRLLKDDVRNAYFTSYNTYSDVKLGKWYNNPISTMSALGIINGYPDGTFRPDAPITRAEFAAIAARFDETATRGTTTFVDVYGHWAADEIAKAYGNDWIKGYPDGTFRPDRNITRAEAMTLINRVLDRAPESPADLLPDMNKWSDNMDTTKWYYLDIQEATNSHDYTRKTFDYEMWKRMLLDPDWSRYER